MKPAIKYSLLGGLAGALLMFVAVLIIEWQLDKYPPLDTQVIEYLENQGYPVDTLGCDLYAFKVDGDTYIFDYFPDDEMYLRFFAGYEAKEFSRSKVEDACFQVMNRKKNCIMVPEEDEDGMAVRIFSESYISKNSELDTEIIHRAIRSIEQAGIQFYRYLDER